MNPEIIFFIFIVIFVVVVLIFSSVNSELPLVTDIETYRSIARQRLGKHNPAGANEGNNRTSIARQWIS
jgi:hypothetical protein